MGTDCGSQLHRSAVREGRAGWLVKRNSFYTLKSRGVSVRMVVYPRAGHSPREPKATCRRNEPNRAVA